MKEKDTQKRIEGTTLQVYVYLLSRKEGISARKVQRDLELSSPSLSLYHLNKLIEMELVEVDSEGQYIATTFAKTGILTLFSSINNRIVPRLSMYALFTWTILVTVILTLELQPRSTDVLLVLVLGVISSLLTIEAWKINRLLSGD